ncbi:hypothetical protein Goshw_013022 [Gossypium schwendimanii]|uniref:RNase H type-1 domain-containing protein n=1 Tax=Gossypium schwendimanii TaxID=34291 RepID=A0A7J9N2X3_GOSSC|nr:hypothetical protein [Gossypium schwendimanii]
MSPRPQKREKPPIEIIKINVDATIVDSKIGIGVIPRDSDGFVLGGNVGVKGEHMCVEWAELSVLIEGTNWDRSHNYNKVIFEFNCASLVNRFRKHQEDITILEH